MRIYGMDTWRIAMALAIKAVETQVAHSDDQVVRAVNKKLALIAGKIARDYEAHARTSYAESNDLEQYMQYLQHKNASGETKSTG